jgi:hypothetical protein
MSATVCLAGEKHSTSLVGESGAISLKFSCGVKEDPVVKHPQDVPEKRHLSIRGGRADIAAAGTAELFTSANP